MLSIQLSPSALANPAIVCYSVGDPSAPLLNAKTHKTKLKDGVEALESQAKPCPLDLFLPDAVQHQDGCFVRLLLCHDVDPAAFHNAIAELQQKCSGEINTSKQQVLQCQIAALQTKSQQQRVEFANQPGRMLLFGLGSRGNYPTRIPLPPTPTGAPLPKLSFKPNMEAADFNPLGSPTVDAYPLFYIEAQLLASDGTVLLQTAQSQRFRLKGACNTGAQELMRKRKVQQSESGSPDGPGEAGSEEGGASSEGDGNSPKRVHRDEMAAETAIIPPGDEQPPPAPVCMGEEGCECEGLECLRQQLRVQERRVQQTRTRIEQLYGPYALHGGDATPGPFDAHMHPPNQWEPPHLGRPPSPGDLPPGAAGGLLGGMWGGLDPSRQL